MSDTSLAAVERLRRDFPGVENVTRLVRSFAEKGEEENVVRFTEIFLSKAPRAFLAERSPEAQARVALGTYHFLARADRSSPRAEVFNPSEEGDEGWSAPVTVIRANVTERPFIVDTIREFVHSRGLAVVHYIYPVLFVGRDAEGKVTALGPSRDGPTRESVVHCEVSRVADPVVREEMARDLERRLRDVVASTDDFRPMLERVNRVVGEIGDRIVDLPLRSAELKEVQDFLRWLRDGAFIFLGYRGYDVVETDHGPAIGVEAGSGLGVLRDDAGSQFARPVPLSDLPEGIRELAEGGPTLIISKANSESTVHRRARMDYIGVKKLDAEGRVEGEHRFLGLFTSRAFVEEAEKIPILRQKLQDLLFETGVAEGSHDYKEIITIFNSMPKEELFLTSSEEIGRDVQAVLTSYGSDDVRVTLRDDPLRRGVSVMVILPKERFSGEVRKSIEDAFVKAFKGDVLNYHLALGAGDQARLHFYVVSPPEQVSLVAAGTLEPVIRELIRNWEDRVREGLERHLSADLARKTARYYAQACSPEYRVATDPKDAVHDILRLESMKEAGEGVSIALSDGKDAPPGEDGEEITALKLYLRGERLILSDFMPILENAGLRVIAVSPFEIRQSGAPESIMYLFAVQGPDRRPIPASRGELLSELILRVRAGDATNDTLNCLVLSAGLAWREVEVIRSYASYAFQLGAVPSRFALPSALNKYPGIARTLFELFQSRFDPGQPLTPEARRVAAAVVRARFVDSMADVGLLADDRALRRLGLLIDATVRTNYYRAGGANPTRRSGGVPYLALKFSVKSMESLNRSRLAFEVWVRSPRMEGVHLRGAKVARGGIRWSDRPDDFRTEVGGLVKTQMVKNAVIVPAGSKGGFFPLRQLTDPEAAAEDGKEQYRTLVRGLLDLTDNLVEEGLVPPPDVVRWDDDDPYLVVAADKGTAKFSDVANAVAAEYGFWLADAFASGGSNGYDHKTVGITARGGWECVRRHFREMGKDIQTEPFTVVGIGDMSGDVFGNGMLLSRQIRLLAAFDHRHIFLDPDPDPEASFLERERLFALGRSSWGDYNTALLSQGGAIIPRGAKSVDLHPNVRLALGIPEEMEIADGEALIRAVLRAPAELLWNGGIGTYVKSAAESRGDVGDTSNDAVRIDARELRVRVVGEGGNLGMTQRARIEFALAGGRINTDAIDNSGGVDLSDHEVNLKILLSGSVAHGAMTPEERNTLLEELTDDVAELVLRNNRSQSLAISLDEVRAREGVEDFRHLMSSLERQKVLDRQDEELPDWETLLERLGRGQSLTRPELCILLAYSKLNLTSRILAGSLPDDPAARMYLRDYFPERAREAAGDELERHRLRREIIAGQFTNELVDLMGSSFVERVVRDTGRGASDVARAWLITAGLANARELIERLREAEERLPAPVVGRWSLGLARVMERTVRWILAHVDGTEPVAEVVAASAVGLGQLREAFGDVVSGADRALYEDLVDELEELGAGEDFARGLITLRFLDQLLEILRVARVCDADPVDSARAFYRMAEVLRLTWLRHTLLSAAGDDRWEQRVVQGLMEDLTRAHHRVTVLLMERVRVGGDVEAEAAALVATHAPEVQRFQDLLQELGDEERVSVAGASVAVREVTLMAERMDGGSPS